MNIERYKNRLTMLLEQLYQGEKQGYRKLKKDKIEGYIEAGLASEIIATDEVKSLIDTAHIKIHGIPFDERQSNKLEPEFLDIPTYIRNRELLHLNR